MKRLLLLAAALMASSIAGPLCRRADAQVSVIRKLPDSGVKQGAATWREAYPEPQSVRASGAAELSGRLSVGGRGGQDPSGQTLYDFATDSRVTLIQPLGAAGALSVEAAALRSRSATDENQDYGGTVDLDFQRLQLGVSGGYSQSRKPVEDTDREEMDAFVEASLTSGLLETLPMNLSYRSTWTERKDDDVSTESSRTDAVTFKAAGSVGRIGVEMSGALDYEDDEEEQTTVLGTVGRILLTVPVADRLAVQATAVPNFNRSEDSTTSLDSTSLESGLGILWTVLEDLQTRLRASRVDSWAKGIGVTYKPYQTTWKAEAGLDYQPPAGLFAGAAYLLAKTTGGNLSHELVVPAGWRGERGTLREIAGSGAADFVRTEDGARVKDALDWNLSMSLIPKQQMTLNGDYLGGYVWEEGSESWNHKLEAAFAHSPDPLLDYRASASVSNNQEEESEGLWKHQYHAGFTLKPRWKLNMYTVDLSETVAVSNGSSGNDILSTAALNVTIPLAPAIGTRLGAQWERINRTAPGEDPGNNFYYVAGLSVAGQGAPFSLSVQYSVSHGYRGVRHDVGSELLVPFRSGFALEGVFSLSSYEEDGSGRLPFLGGLNLVYEF